MLQISMSIIGEILGFASDSARLAAEQANFERSMAFNEKEAETGRQFSHEEAAISRDFSAEEAAKAREFSAGQSELAYQRELEADSTKYQRQVADMRAAGLNPMLAVSAGAGSIHAAPGSTAMASSSSASPVTASAPSAPNLGSLMSSAMQMKELEIRSKLADAQVRNIDADTDKKIGETTGIELDNDVKVATAAARSVAQDLENQLTRSKVKQIDKELEEADARISKLVAETESESERKNLITCQSVLAKAEAGQIIALLPYEKQLKEAKTEEARQAALLSAAHTAYQNKLLSDGYIDSFIRNMSAEADSAEAKAALESIKAAIRTGDYSKTGDLYKGSAAKGIMQGLTLLLDNLNPLTKLF